MGSRAGCRYTKKTKMKSPLLMSNYYIPAQAIPNFAASQHNLQADNHHASLSPTHIKAFLTPKKLLESSISQQIKSSSFCYPIYFYISSAYPSSSGRKRLPSRQVFTCDHFPIIALVFHKINIVVSNYSNSQRKLSLIPSILLDKPRF